MHTRVEWTPAIGLVPWFALAGGCHVASQLTQLLADARAELNRSMAVQTAYILGLALLIVFALRFQSRGVWVIAAAVAAAEVFRYVAYLALARRVLAIPSAQVWRAHIPGAFAAIGVAVAISVTKWVLRGHAPTLVVFLAEAVAGALALALCIRFCPLPAIRHELWMAPHRCRHGRQGEWVAVSATVTRPRTAGPSNSGGWPTTSRNSSSIDRFESQAALGAHRRRPGARCDRRAHPLGPGARPAIQRAAATRGVLTTEPAPAPSCLAGGGVAIGAGDDAQSVVNAHGAGTTYIVKAGTHLRNFSVQPKSGDRFCGEPGAVLDGGRSLASAFSGGATNVTLDSITVQEYNPGWQGAAIQPQTHASGWVVRNVSALRNGWAGLLAADGMKILGGHYNDNDQLGIGGNEATGILLDGLDDDPATLDGPELARNHTLHESCEWEAGGMKWDVGQVTVRNAYVHDNDCRGLWADINARGALIEHNLVEDNWAEGIFYEISQDAVIRNNRIYRNGAGRRLVLGRRHHGGLQLQRRGLQQPALRQPQRDHRHPAGPARLHPAGPPAGRLPRPRQSDLRHRRRCHPTGVVADNGANLAVRDISFTGNTIQSSPCE